MSSTDSAAIAPHWATDDPAQLSASMSLAIARGLAPPPALLQRDDALLAAATLWPGPALLLARFQRALEVAFHPQASLSDDAIDELGQVIAHRRAIGQRLTWVADAGRDLALADRCAELDDAVRGAASDLRVLLPAAVLDGLDLPQAEPQAQPEASDPAEGPPGFSDAQLRAVAEELADSFLVLRVARALDQDAALRDRYGRILAEQDEEEEEEEEDGDIPPIPWPGEAVRAERREAATMAAFAHEPRYSPPPVEALGSVIGPGLDVYAMTEGELWIVLVFGPGADAVQVQPALHAWSDRTRKTAVVAPGPVTLTCGDERQCFLMPPIDR